MPRPCLPVFESSTTATTVAADYEDGESIAVAQFCKQRQQIGNNIGALVVSIFEAPAALQVDATILGNTDALLSCS